jgi:hypothetical protein
MRALLVLSSLALSASGGELNKLVAGAALNRAGGAVGLSGTTAVAGAILAEQGGANNAGAAYVFEGQGSTWTQSAALAASVPWSNAHFGQSVDVSGDRILVGAPEDFSSGLVSSGAAYLFERDLGGAGAWGQRAQLFAGPPSGGARFGWSVSLDGDVAVVGALGDPAFGNVGAAYVFERDQGGPDAWGQIARLEPSDGAGGWKFGTAVAVSDTTIVVGAPGANNVFGLQDGAAYVYERDHGGPGNWGELVKLVPPPISASQAFGHAVAIDGDTVVAGDFRERVAGAWNAGAVYVHARDQGGPGAFGLVARLVPADPGEADKFGESVAVYGDVMAVGARVDDHSGLADNGAAYVFERDAGTGAWSQTAKLTASDTADADFLGAAVACSTDLVLAGAPQDDNALGPNAGAVYVFEARSGAVDYCTAGISASGCRATLATAGTASASAPAGFELRAITVEGQKPGLFFFGTTGRQAVAWGNGTSYQCVVPPVRRAGFLALSGSSGACDGAFVQDLNALWCPLCPKAGANPGAGAVVRAQLWYPRASPTESSSPSPRRRGTHPTSRRPRTTRGSPQEKAPPLSPPTPRAAGRRRLPSVRAGRGPPSPRPSAAFRRPAEEQGDGEPDRPPSDRVEQRDPPRDRRDGGDEHSVLHQSNGAPPPRRPEEGDDRADGESDQVGQAGDDPDASNGHGQPPHSASSGSPPASIHARRRARRDASVSAWAGSAARSRSSHGSASRS